MPARLLALVPLAVALNVVIGQLTAALSLPVFLDTIGTVLATALAGPVVGIVTGLVSQAVAGLQIGQHMLAFAPIQVLIALVTWAAARAGGFRSLPHAVAWGLLTGVVAGVPSAVISYYVFQGVTSPGPTAVTTLLAGLGLSRAAAVGVASVGLDLLDKAITFALVGAALRGLPRRLAARFPRAAAAARR